MLRLAVPVLWLVVLAAVSTTPAEDARRPLVYAPAPVDNPLKGLVPYQGDVRDRFPHSMEFNYLPYAALVKDYDEFDWRPLERLLDDIASRGHQTVFRIFLEYPNKSGVIPDFLLKDGLKVTRWPFQEFPDKPAAMLETPDYSDPKLRRSLKNFITALGKKYDGDPRIGFITAGLLGTWGEWHNWPRDDLFASKRVQEEVLDAYESAFQITPILLRYPAGPNDPTKAPTAHRKFGYHDDSFAWATLPTGRKGDEWFFMTALKAAGPEAEARWKTHPIGGEIRPEAWGRVFDPDPGNPRIQNFRQCVEATHVSWLMDSGMFRNKQNPERIRRAMEEVRRMGYEFHCPGVTIRSLERGRIEVKLEIENRGVAPFYYDWRPEFGLLSGGKPIKTFPGSGKLTGLLPGDKPRVWCDVLDLKGVPAGRYVVAMWVPNPMKGGRPLRFANATQDADAPGWLTLGQMEVE